MPTIPRLHVDSDGANLAWAAGLLIRARAGEIVHVTAMKRLAKLMNNSVIGASKLLHFAVPATQPI